MPDIITYALPPLLDALRLALTPDPPDARPYERAIRQFHIDSALDCAIDWRWRRDADRRGLPA